MTIKLLPFDAVVTFAAYLCALLLRFEGSVPSAYRSRFLSFVVLAIVVQVGMAASFGLYGETSRAGASRRIVLTGLTAGLIVFVLDSMGGDVHVPKSVAILGAILATIGIGAVRFVDRRIRFRRPTA